MAWLPPTDQAGVGQSFHNNFPCLLQQTAAWHGMISLVVWLRAKKGCEQDLRQALAANAAASNLEPGCLRWEYARHLEDPREFVICELYADADALASHHHSAHVARWREITPDLIESKKSGRYQVLDDDSATN